MASTSGVTASAIVDCFNSFQHTLGCACLSLPVVFCLRLPFFFSLCLNRSDLLAPLFLPASFSLHLCPSFDGASRFAERLERLDCFSFDTGYLISYGTNSLTCIRTDHAAVAGRPSAGVHLLELHSPGKRHAVSTHYLIVSVLSPCTSPLLPRTPPVCHSVGLFPNLTDHVPNVQTRPDTHVYPPTPRGWLGFSPTFVKPGIRGRSSPKLYLPSQCLFLSSSSHSPSLPVHAHTGVRPRTPNACVR